MNFGDVCDLTFGPKECNASYAAYSHMHFIMRQASIKERVRNLARHVLLAAPLQDILTSAGSTGCVSGHSRRSFPCLISLLWRT